MTIDEIIHENAERNARLHAIYDPISGEGSDTCERVSVTISDAAKPVQYFPRRMVEGSDFIRELIVCGSFAEYGRRHNKTVPKVKFAYICERIYYDFEFWAALFWYIKPKLSEQALKKGFVGKSIPLVPNKGQRKVLKDIYEQMDAGEPIRIILVKARQWGGSTLVQAFMAWMQLVRHKQWNSVICAHVENTARIVRGMYTNALKHYPPRLLDSDARVIESWPYEGSTKTREIKERECRFSIVSSERPEAMRGEDATMAHFSEVASFVTSEGKTPEDVIQGIVSGIAPIAETMVVYESTAKGVGNFFHNEWLRACASGSIYKPVFVAWFEIEAYASAIDDYNFFINSMSEREHELFKLGATLEQIKWYRQKRREYRDEWRFVSEFPSTADEAFQSTGRLYFNKDDISRLERTIREPQFIGELSADDRYGSLALKNIVFNDDTNGRLKVWDKPDDERMTNGRYVVVVDVNRGVSDKADNGIVCVLDRYYMAEGGVPEVVAEWCGHIELRYFIWKAAQIAEWYQHAHLVVESNTLDVTHAAGFELESVFDEIATYYNNLFCHTTAQTIKYNLPPKWGFHTNRATKEEVCSFMQIVLSKDLYIERCGDAVAEYGQFEVKQNGSLGAVSGCHDDRVMTRCIGVWVAYKRMNPPKHSSDTRKDMIMYNPIINEASL